MASKDIRVPDLGSFKDVAVIELLVKPGDTIEVDTPLLTLETEKATMDVPSADAGVIEKLHVEKGSLVSAGSLIATLQVADAAGASAGGQGDAAKPAAPAAATEPAAASAPASAQAAPAATPVPAAQPAQRAAATMNNSKCSSLAAGSNWDWAYPHQHRWSRKAYPRRLWYRRAWHRSR